MAEPVDWDVEWMVIRNCVLVAREPDAPVVEQFWPMVKYR